MKIALTPPYKLGQTKKHEYKMLYTKWEVKKMSTSGQQTRFDLFINERHSSWLKWLFILLVNGFSHWAFRSQPLLDLERNGPNLHYNVWWRLKDSGEEWSNVTTVGSKHVIHNTETYVPYEIKIQARNEFGAGPESNVATGYSGEDSK